MLMLLGQNHMVCTYLQVATSPGVRWNTSGEKRSDSCLCPPTVFLGATDAAQPVLLLMLGLVIVLPAGTRLTTPHPRIGAHADRLSLRTVTGRGPVGKYYFVPSWGWLFFFFFFFCLLLLLLLFLWAAPAAYGGSQARG